MSTEAIFTRMAESLQKKFIRENPETSQPVLYPLRNLPAGGGSGRKPKPIAVVDPTSGIILYIFNSHKEAINLLDLPATSNCIYLCCTGMKQSAYGLQWRYFEDRFDCKNIYKSNRIYVLYMIHCTLFIVYHLFIIFNSYILNISKSILFINFHAINNSR